jgi:hypothetical protein
MVLLLLATALAPAGDVVELQLKGSKTIKGEVLRENLKGIILKDDAASGLIPWARIETINGRPAREWVDQIRQTLKEVLCQDCQGGLVALLCPECVGLGKVYTETRPCTKCAAGGGLPCPAKGCEKGKVDCPAPCLKRSVGIWKDTPGLGPARVFIFRDESGKVTGGRSISERHQGELLEFKVSTPVPCCRKCVGTKSACQDCREAGTYTLGPYKSLGDCKTCGGAFKGAGKVPCTTCLGSSTLPCADCMGTKTVPVLESASPCALCKEGVVKCGLCEETGINEPKAKRNPVVVGPVLSLRGELRQALVKIDEDKFQVIDRITLRDGRSFQGIIVHRMSTGIMLAIRIPSTQDLQILPVLNKHGYRVSAASSSPPTAEENKKSTPLAPAAAPDTVVLKDGTSVTGKIVAKSEELLMVQTPDGKFVKIEASKVAEIRSQPKAPK